jgi:hypothetical protein
MGVKVAIVTGVIDSNNPITTYVCFCIATEDDIGINLGDSLKRTLTLNSPVRFSASGVISFYAIRFSIFPKTFFKATFK